MIFVDTNIVIDLLTSSDVVGIGWSRAAYERALASGPLCCNHVVLAEVAAGAARPDDTVDDLDQLRIEMMDFTTPAALAAGRAFAEYRRRGGQRGNILPDFLIAGHAEAIGAPLLTRDRRLGNYFPDLALITPETHP